MMCVLLFGLVVIIGPSIRATDPADLKRSLLAMQSPESPTVSDTDRKPPASLPKNRTEVDSMSAADEESVLNFAEREQPQLFELLKFLRQKRPSSYQQALRETGRTQQKLENLQQRDPELFQIDSQIWKTRSKLSLIAARLSVKHSSDLEDQLESLVKDLDSQEVARIRLMRDRAAKQLEKWDSQLKDRTADGSTSVQKSLESWKSKIKKQPSARKKP
jgi:hypothetical protein